MIMLRSTTSPPQLATYTPCTQYRLELVVSSSSNLYSLIFFLNKFVEETSESRGEDPPFCVVTCRSFVVSKDDQLRYWKCCCSKCWTPFELHPKILQNHNLPVDLQITKSWRQLTSVFSEMWIHKSIYIQVCTYHPNHLMSPPVLHSNV
jgi:hypothetical protein